MKHPGIIGFKKLLPDINVAIMEYAQQGDLLHYLERRNRPIGMFVFTILMDLPRLESPFEMERSIGRYSVFLSQQRDYSSRFKVCQHIGKRKYYSFDR